MNNDNIEVAISQEKKCVPPTNAAPSPANKGVSEEYIGTRETAKILGLCQDSIQRYCRSGILKGKRLHKHGGYRIAKSAVYALLDVREV